MMTYYRVRILEISEIDGIHLVDRIEEYTIMPEEYEKIKSSLKI